MLSYESSTHTRCLYDPLAAPQSSSASGTCTASSRVQLGTILFQGPVHPAKGSWLGIEWDDPSRGRHSGMYEKTGVRYFTPRVEGAGSFLRADAKGLDVRGRTFEAALRSKYLDEAQDSESVPLAGVRSMGSEESSPLTTQRFATSSNFDVEVVLTSRVTERFQQLERLREVGLEWERVSCATSNQCDKEAQIHAELALQELGRRMRRLEILNLSFSLLPSLHEASRIAEVLPKLVDLALNGNRFRRIVSPTALPGFSRLRRLSLNSTLMQWSELRCAAPSLENLEDLEFGHNRLRSLRWPSAPDSYKPARMPILHGLKRLNLESNELDDWEELVGELSFLPSLTELVVNGNQLSSLKLRDTQEQRPQPDEHTCRLALPRLQRLLLTDNRLELWSNSIDALAESAVVAFPALKSIRLAGNPLTEQTAIGPEDTEDSTASGFQHDGLAMPSKFSNTSALHKRLLLIARLPFIDEIEGTLVSKAERDDAERFWLERLSKGTENKAQLSDWASQHASQLRLKHGGTESTGEGHTPDASRKLMLKDRLIHLRIRPPPSLDGPSMPLSLTVLPSLRTLLLRTQIARALNKPLPKSKYHLVAILQPAEGETEEVRVEVPSADEGKEVSWWGLGEGDSVEVVAVE